MIYFDKPTQEKVVARLSAFLEPGGHLFVGIGHGGHIPDFATTHAFVLHGLQIARDLFGRDGAVEPVPEASGPDMCWWL